MKEIKCKILKEWFTDGVNYWNAEECPITKAVREAGIEGRHAGCEFIATNEGRLIGRITPWDTSVIVENICQTANGMPSEPIRDVEFTVQM